MSESPDRSVRGILLLAVNPRRFHHDVGALSRELRTLSGAALILLILGLNLLLLRFADLSAFPRAQLGPGMYTIFVVFPVLVGLVALVPTVGTVSMSAYYAIVSRRGAFATAGRQLFAFTVYAIPAALSYNQVAFSADGLSLFALIALFVRLSGDLLYLVVFFLSVLGLASFVYYNSRIQHSLNRAESIVSVALAVIVTQFVFSSVLAGYRVFQELLVTTLIF